MRSSSCYNSNKLNSIPGVQLPQGKFRRRQGFTVVFHHDTSWKEFLRHQKVMHGARKLGFNFLPVGDDE